MQVKAAAHYLGVSASKLRMLDQPRKKLGSNVLYDRMNLDIFADNLESDGLTDEGLNQW
jgi:hypothetical protein